MENQSLVGHHVQASDTQGLIITSNTCRSRKLKCDEEKPICQRCQKAGRYCDRSKKTFHPPITSSKAKPGSGNNFPSPSNPREALQYREIAQYLQHYSEIAKWYDLSDPDRMFGIKVPEIALENDLLFSAVLASSAMHLSRTTSPNAGPAAEFYHNYCVSALIALQGDGETISTGIPLAAVSLLRAYETLSEDVDPNRHLLGAYSLASDQHLLSSSPKPGLFMAGFWNYLREDITFSLFEQCPIKMNLEDVQLLDVLVTDQDYLNSISLLLGRIINLAFRWQSSQQDWQLHQELVKQWMDKLPARCKPFSKIFDKDSNSLPSIWFLQECHAAATHYYLVCMILLSLHTPLVDEVPASEDTLRTVEQYALEICGSAFMSDSAPVIVNAFGPMCYCGRYIRDESHRDELVRQILGTKRRIGWPGHVIVGKLKASWSQSEQTLEETTE